MVELISLIILICSLGGIVVLVFWKIPVLTQLSFETESCQENILSKAKQKVKELAPSNSFNSRNFLQKILLRVRILSLKTENKTNNLLQKLSQQDRITNNDNYWEELRKSNKPLRKRRIKVKKGE